jgi:hypothetical protein
MGMDKGLRVGVNGKFNEMLPKLAELGGKTFRRTILDWTVEQYGCTMAAASTHYAFAKNAADKAVPEMTKGLGRAPEKNNGGRKKKVVDAAVVIWTGVKENTSTHTVTINPAAVADAEEAVQTEFTVKKKSDGSVVAEGLSFEAATALVAKAVAAKKAKLYWI